MPSLSRFWSSFGPLAPSAECSPGTVKRYGLRSKYLADLHRLLADRKFPKIHLKSESESIKKMPQRCHDAAPARRIPRRCAETGQHFPLFMCSKCLQKRRRIPFLIEILAFSHIPCRKSVQKRRLAAFCRHRGTKKRGVTDRQNDPARLSSPRMPRKFHLLCSF